MSRKTFNVNVVELARQVFGIKGFIPFIGGTPAVKIEFTEDIPTVEIQEASAQSVFGTPIFEITTFLPGVIPGTEEEYDGLTLVDYPIIEITQPKHIAKTRVQGRKGSVKELISDDDAQVRIRGLLVNHNSEAYPENLVSELATLADLGVSLEIESPVLNLLGIDNLVIENREWPRIEGFTNVQPYILSCSSDTPIELKIKSDL